MSLALPSRLNPIVALALLSLACVQAALAAAAKSNDGMPTATQHVQAFAAGEDRCDNERVQQAVSLIYEQDDMPTAAQLALRCELLARTQKHAFSRTVAARIQALIAMRTRDMAALRRAGESLVAEAPAPEYVADGHMFIAFACLFSGDPQCARTHVDQAKAMFTQLHVADALVQLQPLEQTLMQLEAQDSNDDAR